MNRSTDGTTEAASTVTAGATEAAATDTNEATPVLLDMDGSDSDSDDDVSETNSSHRCL